MKGLLILIGLMIGTLGYAANGDEFPGRKQFPAVPYIELDELYKKRDKVLIVDVRSAYEYDTLRIKGAINIVMHGAEFTDHIARLRTQNPDKDIVMYCNGRTCNKSYEAVQKCRSHNIANVVAYDAGVLDWVKKYPNESELLGRSPVDPAKLISKDQFKTHLLSPEKFDAAIASENALVLDVRDRFQRDGTSLFPGVDKMAALDDRDTMNRYLDKAYKEKRTLYFYDAAGKQVEWLMYYLEDRGVKNYYFMEGGATAYYQRLRKQMTQ